MAIEEGTESVTLSKRERTWRIEIVAEVGADPRISAYREKVRQRADDGSVAQCERGIPVVERSLSAVAEQEFKVGKITLTGAQLAILIADAADRWRKEDIAATKKAADEAAEQAKRQAEATKAGEALRKPPELPKS